MRLPRLELRPPRRPRPASPSRTASRARAACRRPSARRSTARASCASPRFCGLVFGSFSDDVPAIDDYLGDEIAARIERVLHKPVQVIGRFTQALPNNWKLYVENVKDTYHASLLHLFFTTFELNRLSQKGGVIVDESGGHHVSYSMIDKAAAGRRRYYREQGLRSDTDRLPAEGSERCCRLPASSTTASRCRSSRSSPASCCSRSRTASRVRQVLPKGIDRTELNWTYLGYADDTRRAAHRAAEAVEPGRPGRLHLDGRRRRRRLRAARHRRRRRPGGGRRDGRRGHRIRAKAAPPRPRCAASGRPTRAAGDGGTR